jgi:hypothetical protein
MVLETSVLSIFNQLTRLEARENFINFSRRESFKHFVVVNSVQYYAAVSADDITS